MNEQPQEKPFAWVKEYLPEWQHELRPEQMQAAFEIKRLNQEGIEERHSFERDLKWFFLKGAIVMGIASAGLSFAGFGIVTLNAAVICLIGFGYLFHKH